MKRLGALLGGMMAATVAGAADDFFDRVEQALTFTAADSLVRSRVSGLLDLEGYDVQLPAPGLIVTRERRLLSPRLSVFLDAQIGTRIYFFAQGRADRGFDPTRRKMDSRLDEYAVRFTPTHRGRFNVQLGRFATVVGNWTARHASWTNPFITAPLPYESLTGIWDTEAARNSSVLLLWAHVREPATPAEAAMEKSLRVPIVWGPSYATGAAVSGDVGRLRYAAEVKFGSLSSRPESWQHATEQRHHPSVAMRLAFRPSPTWNVGVSASGGTYLREFAERSLPAGRSRGDYRQLVIAQDLAFAWHHLQLWSEIYLARFENPLVGDADTVAYYVEARYKFTPQLFGALRWNQQVFGSISDRGRERSWGNDHWRIDVAPGYRFTPHTQLKLQYSLQHGDSGKREHTRTLAAQFTLRF